MVARACGYENAGTVEFLVDGEKNFYFLEMNTRLQVEHPVTELRTGLDLVALQIRIAAGEQLPFTQEEVSFRGHAIECRICAEDAENNFLPATGRITHLRPPSGPGIREDRGVEEGDDVGVFYDPLLAKLIAWGATRDEARARMVRALREYEVLGVRTNIDLCHFVLTHTAFAKGDISTHFISRYFSRDGLQGGTPVEEAAAAAVCALIARGAENAERAGQEVSRNAWKERRREFLRGQ
jgi:acetyl-CoA carboxylase biotin carboxylase subunit